MPTRKAWYIVLASILVCNIGFAKDVDINKLSKAIYIAEGSEKAIVPFGLITNKWCIEAGACEYLNKEIIRKHLTRCKDGEGAIECIGRQYCPPSAHKLNAHWVKNVTHFYERG